MQPYTFAFVSNSNEIALAVRDFAASLGLHMDVRLATMEKAVPVAQDLLKAGTEVILGGGATGKLLRQRLEKPVVTIARSHMDVLRALLLAREKSRHIGLTCYDTLPEGLDVLAELLNIRLTPISFSTTEELRRGIASAVERGVGCIVGGGICAELARGRGCVGVVVTPGAEVMQRALEEAVNIAASQRQEREQAAWLRGILDSLHEGIVGVNPQGAVVTCNTRAVQLLGADRHNPGYIVAQNLRPLGIPQVLQRSESEQDSVRQVGRQELIVNSRPIMVNGVIAGAVTAFRPVADIRNINHKLKERLRDKGFVTRHTLESLVGASSGMARLRQRAARFAQTEAAVLIQGETGVGKELLAHGIHAASPRCTQPFVAVNCAALPQSLLESELFGHDEGAFTGARRGGKDGLFVLAHGGTIFLDEIGDIPPPLQALLLRVLEAGEIMRVGGDRVISVNVRVISSSWKNLAQEVRAGRFRADLYYRLTTLILHVPSLRERSEDIPAIVSTILRRRGLPEGCFSARGLELLAEHAWPGNVRELEALVRRYVLLLGGTEPDDELLACLLEELRTMMPLVEEGTPTPHSAVGLPLKTQLERREREIIQQTLKLVENNRVEAARKLGISTNTLWRKMKGGEAEFH